MINTLTMMRFPFKNQSLARQVNMMTSCLPKKVVRQTPIEGSRTDRFLPTVRRDEPTPQLREIIQVVIVIAQQHCRNSQADYRTNQSDKTVLSDSQGNI